ncbi:hypothetical protein MN116_000019 [Schistosoma mekongi]|uniref:RNA-directed DNA polymerase n=1 Tax=Schistosoma mekongi TaxID=38744 RepID=A0AAE1Z9J3_SCHME|nr:hypothetical protein MN116_000019 [Schistosoma mekongi]
MICARFTQGLQDRDLQLQLLRFPVQCVSEALTMAQRFEDAARSTINPTLFTIQHRRRPVSKGRGDSFHTTEPTKRNCYYCKRFGMFAVKCGHNRQIRAGERDFCVSVFNSHDFAPVTVLGRVEGMEKMVLIDTGASTSVVRWSFVSNIKVPLVPASRGHHLITADGSVIQAQFSTTLTLQFGGLLCKQLFLVCDYITWDIILGVDFLRKNRALVDFSTSCVLVGRHVVPIATTVDSKCMGAVDASNQLSMIDKVSIGSHLDRQTRYRVVSVLMKFREVFEENGLPGRTRAVWHEIDTGDHKPIKQYPRRVPIHYQPELDKMIKEMLKHKVIRPSTSPWASPIVLVKKKDNSLRLCVDYRRLNAITKRDSFPLPRIDETLDVLGGAQWFSTLDLASGYWQVEIRPKDRQKTAFVIPTGLYEFETMPFGLTNAPATFQRLMQTILEGLVPKRCLIYLDDIIVHGRTIEQHMENLRIVLDRIRANGLKLRPNKCQFLKQSVTFLGHYITSRGVQTDCSKVQAVQSWPSPTSAAEVKSFMGLASYYRRFVANFAGIAAPLHRLTEKGRKFLWTAECQSAFEELKAKLAAAPILGFPDTSLGPGPFILDTDASDHAIGAVLSQISPGGQEKVISYGSRKLDKREVNYSTTRREMLALVYFMKHFRHYLLGRQFRVRTDHKTLQWLSNFREADGQLARWQETLQEFDYVCEYRRGAQHLNADAMSRHPAPVEVVNSLLTADSEVDWGSLQAADPDLALVYARQQHGNDKPTSQEMKDMTTVARCICVKWEHLRLCNDVLYLMEPSKPPRLIVPRAKTSYVITRMHEQLGHAGTRKTEAAIRTRFWWPLIHRDVEEFCKSCDTCARVKSPSKHSRAKLIPMVTTAPYQRAGVDVMGPFPTSQHGNRYILVMVDYFTKWFEAVPIPQQDAATIAKVFINTWIARYGAPTALHSDQGPAFESYLIANVCSFFGIRKTRTTAYHPQGNGLVERTNRTLKMLLRSFVHQAPAANWDDLLPQCLLAYRSSVHSSTGFSPAQLLFGHELKLPIEIQLPPHEAEEKEYVPYVRSLHKRLVTAYRLAHKNHLNASNHQRECYDRGSHGPEYRIGDRVWLNRPTCPPGQSTKLHAPWQGPFTIVAKRSPVTFVLRHLDRPNDNLLVAHYNHLKPANTTSSSSLETSPVVAEYEVPSEGGDAYQIPRSGTEDSASLPRGGVV